MILVRAWVGRHSPEPVGWDDHVEPGSDLKLNCRGDSMSSTRGRSEISLLNFALQDFGALPGLRDGTALQSVMPSGIEKFASFALAPHSASSVHGYDWSIPATHGVAPLALAPHAFSNAQTDPTAAVTATGMARPANMSICPATPFPRTTRHPRPRSAYRAIVAPKIDTDVHPTASFGVQRMRPIIPATLVQTARRRRSRWLAASSGSASTTSSIPAWTISTATPRGMTTVADLPTNGQVFQMSASTPRTGFISASPQTVFCATATSPTIRKPTRRAKSRRST